MVCRSPEELTVTSLTVKPAEQRATDKEKLVLHGRYVMEANKEKTHQRTGNVELRETESETPDAATHTPLWTVERQDTFNWGVSLTCITIKIN